MACSKVFSGDLPELTDEIMQYLRKDLSTLYSCIFVNRLWCRLAIPLLWEDPFLIPNQHYRCIGAYLSFLNEDSKAKFNEYGIDDKLLLSNTLFNYPSFIKYFDTYRVCRSANYDTLSSNVLQNLGQVLPSKLEYLRLKFLFKTSDLEIFLKNSQNTFIKKLIIGNIMSIKGENILFYIKEYIMKKERVKYLAIVFDDELNNEIFHLKDEVNEFKLHNIIVKRFSDLYIDAYNFVNDLNK
ncbi:uncharacterized protein OCT59_017706 [Rhizophagus irregularis]|uniref:uncharacterized protein n=1 Tax=Rhizophagus irregularis TaxID=588596 RepID=UPI003316F91C|nr:hypothetical protein OCT59_017706 [Rhizophagus irregularis]